MDPGQSCFHRVYNDELYTIWIQYFRIGWGIFVLGPINGQEEMRTILKELFNAATPVSLLISAKRWMDGYGNTYHSVRLWVNGKVIDWEPCEYGYGDCYLITAQRMMERAGIISRIEYGDFTRWLSVNPHYYVLVADVQRKRDLK